MFVSDHNQQLDDLLGTSIAEFDMPDAVYARAVARYQHLARWLAEYWPESHAGGEVYPQGSIRLGTVTRPINPGDDYDIDLVCRRDVLVTSTTKAELKADVDLGIKQYVATRPDGGPKCREGNRCWTLDYPGEPFHMDVLPAIPDFEARPNGIFLTDRDLHEWQHSNPVDYATWFRGRMAAEYMQLREAAAVAKRMDVEDAPDWEVKTTLQRSVQALKRHRDIYFARTSEDKPASIVITTLAAMAYRGQASMFEVLVDVVGRMPGFVEDRSGVLWIPNPVQPEENFADRWRAHPERADRFFDWIASAEQHFTGLGEERGLAASSASSPRASAQIPSIALPSARLQPCERRARTGSLASAPAPACSGRRAHAPCHSTPSTAMRRRPSARSLAQQAFALQASFPAARIQLTPQQLLWRGTITPTALSRDYTITVSYRIGGFPKIRVVVPALQCRPGKSIPHLFSDGSLCLHLDDEWSAGMLLVHTTIPWTSEWLFNYEIWLATSAWHGGGEWPPRRQADSTRSRTRRRRSANEHRVSEHRSLMEPASTPQLSARD